MISRTAGRKNAMDVLIKIYVYNLRTFQNNKYWAHKITFYLRGMLRNFEGKKSVGSMRIKMLKYIYISNSQQ